LIIKLYDEEMADESQDFWYAALPYLLALCVGSGAMWTHAEAILAGWDNAWLRGSRRAIASEIDRGVIDELRAGVRYSTSNTRRSAGGPTSRSASMDHRKEAGACR
jgi:hypothetical protein